MSSLSSPATSPDATPGACIEASLADVTGSPVLLPDVSDVRQRQIRAAALERDIEWFGQLAAQCQARYDRTHCLTAIGDRDRWLLAQREAIRRQGANQS